jgi:hypothetical protein
MDRCCIPYRLAPYTNHFLFLVDPNQQLLIAFHPNNLLRYLKRTRTRPENTLSNEPPN